MKMKQKTVVAQAPSEPAAKTVKIAEFPDKPMRDKWEGNHLLNFEPNKDKYALKMGYTKIKAVLSHVKACQQFVDDYEAGKLK